MGQKVGTLKTSNIQHISVEEALPKEIHDALDSSENEMETSNQTKYQSEFLDFPFISDPDTVKYISESKTVFIMKGLPGSGKSYIAKKLSSLYNDAPICSADLFFYENGVYKFDPHLLGKAHASCQESVVVSTLSQCPVIIIDNTNVRYWEMKFYLILAHKFNYNVIVVEPKTPWKFDASILSEKNSHGVDSIVIRDKVNIYEPIKPLYFGWFLNDIDSIFLLKMATCWVERLMKVQEFREHVQRKWQTQTTEDVIKYFSKGRKRLNKAHVLHCTARYTGRSSSLDIKYSSEVMDTVGKMFRLKVTGYVITKRTFGARVTLAEDQQSLWMNESDPTSDIKGKSTNKQPMNAHSVPIPEYNLSDKEITTRATLKVVPIDTDLSAIPSHITLGTHSGIPPAQTEDDLQELIDLESTPNDKVYRIPGAEVKSFGEIWAIYPTKMAVFSSLFNCDV